MFEWFKRSKSTEPPPSRPARRGIRSFFTGAATDRLTASWPTTPITADAIINRHQRVLVARSREQVANNDYAKAFVRLSCQNIVGSNGIMLQAQAVKDDGELDTKSNQAIEAAFAEWGHRANCDVTGRLSWRALQNAAVASAAKDGEFFFRKIYGAEAGPWGFSLQILDPQRCPVDLNDDRPDKGGFIRHGIHFNKYGRPLAYYFETTDETEVDYRFGGRQYIRVPADDIIHGFLPEIVGQKRGLPWMSTGLFRLRHLNGFEDAAVVNARVGAAKMGFIQWKEGQGPEFEEGDDIEIEAAAGEFPILPEGAELKEWAPQYPSGEFAPFYKAMLRGFASGAGVAYNNLANDLEGVNFSSIRQGTLDEREHWKDKQEWLIESLTQPVFEAWLPRALLAGRIKVKGRPLSAANIDRYSAIAWQPRRWQWIDPRADVDAAVESKNNMLASPGQIIREQGRDPQTVWDEAARDVRDMIQSFVRQGIDEATAKELVLLSMGRQPPKPAPNNAPKVEA